MELSAQSEEYNIEINIDNEQLVFPEERREIKMLLQLLISNDLSPIHKPSHASIPSDYKLLRMHFQFFQVIKNTKAVRIRCRVHIIVTPPLELMAIELIALL